MKKMMFLFGAVALMVLYSCDKGEQGGDNGPVVTKTEAIDLSEIAQFIGNS